MAYSATIPQPATARPTVIVDSTGAEAMTAGNPASVEATGGTIDTVTTVSTVSSVTDCANVQSVDLVDAVTSITNDVDVVLKNSGGTEVGTATTPLKVQIHDGTTGAEVDSTAGYLVFMDVAHHKIHEEAYYNFAHYDNDVDIAGPKYIRITTPNTATRIHFVYEVDVGASGGLIELYENPTLLAAGTQGTPRNSNRNSASTATATVFYDSTTQPPNNDGTLLEVHFVGVSGGAAKSGGSVEARHEWILKQNTTYLVKFTATADNTAYTGHFHWYEV